MHPFGPLSSAVLLFLAGEAAARACGCREASPDQAGDALYFITNSEDNAVVSVPIGEDGTLSGGVLTQTGGKGDISIDGSTNSSAKTDGLVSQSSLSIAGRHLFAVNAGSNTVSMFAIDPADATKLRMIGSPAEVPGEFVNTVAASADNKLVCAGATGKVAGISCASFNHRSGIGKMDALRPLDLQQSTPPVGPTNTLSQVFWSDDENTLFATIKGDPTKNNTGFLASFPLEEATSEDGDCAVSVAQEGARSSPNGTAVLFGSLPIPDTTDIFATDASFGGAILSVDGQGQANLDASQPIDDQKATCWVTISQATRSAFVTDVAAARMVEMSLDNASIMGQVDVSSTGASGMIDLRASGRFVYALAPGDKSQVIVMDVKGGSKRAKVVQAFDIGALGAGASSQGMAIFEK